MTTAPRLAGVRAALAEARLDALLVGHPVNVRYLTGFTGSAGYLVVGLDAATLYVDGRYSEQAEQQAQGAAVTTTGRDILGDVLARLPRRIGVEGHLLPLAQWQRISDAGVEAVATASVVERLRARKDPDEVAAIRRAVEITDRACAEMLAWIVPGMPEREVAARLEYAQRLAGGDRKDTQTAVGSGPRSALPHCIASDRVLGANEAVMVDLGCRVDGYTSDLTRTIFLGDPPDAFRRIHEVVAEAQEAAIAGLRPGMTGREVHALAHERIRAAGYGDAFPHALGHSLGLEIHERPQFSALEAAVIEPGNVITVEPGIYLPGRFGVRTEDVVLVTESGCEVLSARERALVTR